MYDHTLHYGKKTYFRYCLQFFSIAEILKSHTNDSFKINDKQIINILKKDKYFRFTNYEKKINLAFKICDDFEVY